VRPAGARPARHPCFEGHPLIQLAEDAGSYRVGTRERGNGLDTATTVWFSMRQRPTHFSFAVGLVLGTGRSPTGSSPCNSSGRPAKHDDHISRTTHYTGFGNRWVNPGRRHFAGRHGIATFHGLRAGSGSRRMAWASVYSKVSPNRRGGGSALRKVEWRNSTAATIVRDLFRLLNLQSTSRPVVRSAAAACCVRPLQRLTRRPGCELPWAKTATFLRCAATVRRNRAVAWDRDTPPVRPGSSQPK